MSKTTSTSISSGISVLTVWVLSQFNVNMPVEVAATLTGVLNAITLQVHSYMRSRARKEEQVVNNVL